MNNSQRMLVKIISEICAENDYKLERYSFDWILQLKKVGKTARVFGYQFENNTATACLICTDKSASSELLRAARIPVVEHMFFTSPKILNISVLRETGKKYQLY
jgi:hypothetical protein